MRLFDRTSGDCYRFVAFPKSERPGSAKSAEIHLQTNPFEIKEEQKSVSGKEKLFWGAAPGEAR